MTTDSVVSDSTYNLLAILLSKLEGLEAYDAYLPEMNGEAKQIVENIRRDDERHAQILREHIEKLVKSSGLK